MYFGAGWTDAQRTAAGPVRHGEDGATLLLPLERGVAYRLLLDLVATGNDALDLDVTLIRPARSARADIAAACNSAAAASR